MSHSLPPRTAAARKGPSPKQLKQVARDLERGELERVEQRLSTWLGQAGSDAGVLGLQGRLRQKQERFEEAVEAYRQSLAIRPEQPGVLTNLAACLNRLGHTEEALAEIERVLHEDATRVTALTVKGDIFKQSQRIPEALACYREALRQDPEQPMPYQAMAHLTTFTPESAVFRVLGKALENDGLELKARVSLHYNLGKAYLDIGDDERAFAHYQQANALMDESLPPIRAELEKRLAFTRRHFTPPLFEAFAAHGDQRRPQIIVAGMSRSGKSLVESLFRGVKGVTLAGEELVLGEYATECLAPVEGRLADYIAQLTPEQLARDAQGYVARLDPGDEIKITTVPGDLWYLGLVGLWAPRVPIVFCVRDLLDLGVTGYFHQYQIPEGYRYSYDLHQLGRQIACSERVMEHWAQALPNPVYLVDYNALTRDPEAVMQNLLHDLGLERERDYREVVGENAALVDDISPIVSSDVPMPIVERFNRIGERFRDYLDPLIEGYRTIADVFPRLEEVTAFPTPLPEQVSDPLGKGALPSETVTFDWQLAERVVALDNGGQLLTRGNPETLLGTGAISLIAFDPAGDVPLPPELQEHPHCQRFPHTLLGNGKPTMLHACLDPALSGTLPLLPEAELPAAIRGGARRLASLPVSSVALDAIEGLPGVDWLLLDARHDVRAILENGARTLSEALVLQVEVAFQPLREGEATLAELNHWAARNGFCFYRLFGMYHDRATGAIPDLVTQPPGTQLITAQALFLPDRQRLQALTDVQRLKLAFVLDSVYELHDMCHALLSDIGATLGERYLQAYGYCDPLHKGPPPGECLALRQAMAAGQLDQVASTFRDWRRALARSPWGRALQGEHASWSGKHDLAIAQLAKAIEEAPEDIGLRKLGLEVLLRAGCWWEVQRIGQRLLSRCPDDAQLRRLHGHGVALSPVAEPAAVAEAIALYQTPDADAAPAERAEQAYVRALLLARSGQPESALEAHREAITLAAAPEAPAWVLANAHLYHGRTLEGQAAYRLAAEAYWQAAMVRPASCASAQAQQHLMRLWETAFSEDTALSALGTTLRELKKTHRKALPMADFELLRQGLAQAWLPGSRPTETRLAAYDLAPLLPERCRALDVNAEQGFLLLGLAENLGHAEGLAMSEFQQALCAATAEALAVDAPLTSEADLASYKPRKKAYDLVLACGVHRSKELTPAALGEALYKLCAPGGIVLLESSGIRSATQVEPDFAKAAEAIASAGFTLERVGELCDDGVNLREFRLLRRA